jgi:ATP-binding cassette subfamily C protein LapB
MDAAVARLAPVGARTPVEYSGASHQDDPLVASLVILSRLFGHPKSPAALVAGLPIRPPGMSPELFMRAADRVGLAASIAQRPLEQIRPFAMPCVLLLRERQACVLLRRLPGGEGYEIATPDNLEGAKSVSAGELAESYTGTAIVVRPKIRLDHRSSEFSGKKPKSWFWGSVLKFRAAYLEVVLAALLINIFGLLSPLFTMQIYDRVVPLRAFDTMWVLAIGLVVGYGFDFILRTLRGYFLDRAGRSLDRQISARIYEHVLSMKMSEAPASAGAFASNVREFEPLRDFFTSISMTAIVDMPFLFLFIIAIWWIAGPIAFIPMAMIPLVIAANTLTHFPMQRAVERSYRQGAQKQAALVETITGLDSIKAASAEGHIQHQWDGYVGAMAQSGMVARLWGAISSNLTLLMSNMSTITVVIWGVYRTAEGDMTMGAMVAASMLMGRCLQPLSMIAGLAVRFSQSISSLQGLNRLMEKPSERPYGKVFMRRPVFDGAIEFRDVVFSYPDQETRALDGVSFHIAPGERVGIVGRIGSGKTTIERLILGLYEPESGAVLVDGTDIRQVDPADLRRNIGAVLQDQHIFFGSIKDNIVLGASFVDEESVVRAASIAGVDSFVRSNPHGYDLQVGEAGRRLSGGQRQSIFVARALLMNPPILLLDEPTSAMDNSTENGFKARLAQAIPGKTLLLVTHRNSMLSLVDRLIVMDGGKIVADGPKAGVLDALMKGRIRAADV